MNTLLVSIRYKMHAQIDLKPLVMEAAHGTCIQRFGHLVVCYARCAISSIPRECWVYRIPTCIHFTDSGFSTSQRLTMVVSTYFHLALLVVFAYANPTPTPTPTCVNPPPSWSIIPHLGDCLDVTEAILGIARTQRNRPQVWSRAPRTPGHGLKLPVSFSFPGEGGNTCEFVVDVVSESALDIFPTKMIAGAADGLINDCLIGNRREASTVGHTLAGPRQVVQVTMRKKIVYERNNAMNRTVYTFDGTELVLMELAPHGTANLTLAR